MFSFFKRNPKQLEPIVAQEQVSVAEKQTILVAITTKQAEIKALAPNNQEALAKKYEELGVLQEKIASDESIDSLEKSFSYQPSIGAGYKALMRLYNQKRSEAAYNGNDQDIEKWMSKMDELRQIARNKTISG